MNLKKMLMTAFVFAIAGAGFAQTPETAYLSPAEIKTKLERNEILPSIYLSPLGGATKNKTVLGQLAQKQVVKHRNYVAYYNAAVIYFTDKEWYDDASHDLTATDLANVKKYATGAIRLSPKTPDMYLVRGMAIHHFLELGALGNMSTSDRDLYTPAIKKNRALVLEMLADFEKVGELNPVMAPWGDMVAIYEALGKKDEAKRCQAKYNTYTKIAEEKARKANYIQRSVQMQMNPKAKKSGAHAGVLPMVKSYDKAVSSASLPTMGRAGAAGALPVLGGSAYTAGRAGAVASLATPGPAGVAGVAGGMPAAERARNPLGNPIRQAGRAIRKFVTVMNLGGGNIYVASLLTYAAN